MADQIKTGLLELDRLLSEPLRPGEIAEIPGPEATVKTDLRQLLIRRALEDGKTAVHIDFEMSQHPGYYEQMLGRRKRDDDPDDPITP